MMEIIRKDLLHALKTAEPALSARDLLPKLQMLWFDGAVVRATDGTIGIEAPLVTEFTGGVPGAVLVGFVESLTGDHLKVEADDKSVTFVSAQSKIKLPLEPAASSVWPFPKANADPEATIGLAEDWQQALDFGMLSVTNNTTHDERRGITFEATKSSINLYATDGTTIAWAQMPKPKGYEIPRFTIPGDFVKETLRLMSDGGELLLRDTSIEAVNQAGVHIYSKLSEVNSPTQYAEKIRTHVSSIELLPLPDGLKEALGRAELLKDNKDGIQAKFTFIDKDLLVVEASSSFGDLKEELYLEGEHAELAVMLTPSFVLRALEGRDSFAITNRCLILSGPEHLTYMVAAYKPK